MATDLCAQAKSCDECYQQALLEHNEADKVWTCRWVSVHGFPACRIQKKKLAPVDLESMCENQLAEDYYMKHCQKATNCFDCAAKAEDAQKFGANTCKWLVNPNDESQGLCLREEKREDQRRTLLEQNMCGGPRPDSMPKLPSDEAFGESDTSNGPGRKLRRAAIPPPADANMLQSAKDTEIFQTLEPRPWFGGQELAYFNFMVTLVLLWRLSTDRLWWRKRPRGK